jgi:hypothetical protein
VDQPVRGGDVRPRIRGRQVTGARARNRRREQRWTRGVPPPRPGKRRP